MKYDKRQGDVIPGVFINKKSGALYIKAPRKGWLSEE